MKTMSQFINKAGNYLSLVKFSHTIFALPFAFIGFFIAVSENGFYVNYMLLLLVLLSMIFARTSAMAFNRYIDRDIDAKNPRTEKREIPQNVITPTKALFFTIINIIAFIATTYFINDICFFLSPVALFVVLFYSYTKRFTSMSHFILGLGLSLAPVGAYLAVKGSFALLPVLVSLLVLLWVGGFDIIYSLQDEKFDRQNKLHSIPARLGAKNALALSWIVHLLCFILTLAIGLLGGYQLFYWIGAFIFNILLCYQHFIVKHDDLSRLNIAFGTLNGLASVIYALFTIADLYFCFKI
jgi:4-hydroxybenzoate polyprenyltransferase